MKALSLMLVVSMFSVSCAMMNKSKCGCGDSCAKEKSAEHKCGGACDGKCEKKKS